MNCSGLTETQQRRIERALENVHFAKLIGIQLDTVEPGMATMTMEVRPELTQNNGVVHGGAIASLVDSATAFAIIPLLQEQETATTVDLTISYVRPLTKGVVKASARVLREGARIIAVSADVFDQAGNLAATALSTYLRLSAR
jgi:uncharacterized protein (TIGR00369 family)